MHNGPLVLRRMYMQHAKPFHQLLICAAVSLVGAALLVVTGQLAGIALIVFGVVLALPILRTGRSPRTPGEPGDHAHERLS
jgi:hypothetical protein